MGRVSSRTVSNWSRWLGGWGFRGVFWVGRIFIVFFSFVTRPFFYFRQRKPLLTGVRRGCHHLISLSVCVTFVVFTDCESCTRPISTNQGSVESGECGLTLGTWFLARRLEMVAVAGLMWVSWCVFRGVEFFRAFHEFTFSNS